MKRGGAGEYSDEPWFKVARRLFRSSIWEEDPATRIVWITLLHLAQLPENRKHGHGMVLMTRGNLCREAFVTAEQLEHALMRLTAPDPTSRTAPGEARIEILGNGYRIRSFDQYHDVDDWDARREQRVAAGRARAAKAARAAEAAGKGGRGRFAIGAAEPEADPEPVTSDEPATAGNLPADSLVSTSYTETETETTNSPPVPPDDGGAQPRRVYRVGEVLPSGQTVLEVDDHGRLVVVSMAPAARASSVAPGVVDFRPGHRAERARQADRLVAAWLELAQRGMGGWQVPIDARTRIQRGLRDGRTVAELAGVIASDVRDGLLELGLLAQAEPWPPAGWLADELGGGADVVDDEAELAQALRLADRRSGKGAS